MRNRYILWHLRDLKGKTCNAGLKQYFNDFGSETKLKCRSNSVSYAQRYHVFCGNPAILPIDRRELNV